MKSADLICRCCGGLFNCSDAHRDFLAGSGCSQPPLYCDVCFADRLRQIWEIPGEKRVAICSACGKQTRLCFVPLQDRPVFCQQCFKQKQPVKSAL